MKIREVSPCETCKWEPAEKEECVAGDTDYYFDLSDECPISMNLDCDIPVETWYDITRLTGCSCWRQKGDKNV
jgi:hypothetical protein